MWIHGSPHDHNPALASHVWKLLHLSQLKMHHTPWDFMRGHRLPDYPICFILDVRHTKIPSRSQQELKNGGLVDDFPFPPKYLWGSKFVLQRCMMGDFYSNILRLEYSPLKLAVSSWRIPPFQKEIHRIPTIGFFWVAMLVYPKGSWEVGKMSHDLARWVMPWLCTVVL